MNTLSNKLVISGLVLVFTLLTGFLLSRLGRPYNGLVFNVHKLIALAAVIYLGISINQVRGSIPVNAAVWGLVGLAGLFFLSLFVSGAILSIGKPADVVAVMRTIHRVIPYLAVISLAAAVTLLINGKLLAQ